MDRHQTRFRRTSSGARAQGASSKSSRIRSRTSERRCAALPSEACQSSKIQIAGAPFSVTRSETGQHRHSSPRVTQLSSFKASMRVFPVRIRNASATIRNARALHRRRNSFLPFPLDDSWRACALTKNAKYPCVPPVETRGIQGTMSAPICWLCSFIEQSQFRHSGRLPHRREPRGRADGQGLEHCNPQQHCQGIHVDAIPSSSRRTPALEFTLGCVTFPSRMTSRTNSSRKAVDELRLAAGHSLRLVKCADGTYRRASEVRIPGQFYRSP